MLEKKDKGELYKFWTFAKDNRMLIITTIISVILSYGYEMSHFALTIDEEANWNATGYDYFARRVSDGRFFWGFTKIFSPRIFMPFWSTALFSIIMVLNGCLLTYVFRKYLKSELSRCAFACIFVSFPVHAYYVMFSQQSAEIALGYFLTIWAVYFVDKNLKGDKIQIRDFVFAGIFMILANGIYQAFVCVYITLVCAMVSIDLLETRHMEKEAPQAKAFWKRMGIHIGSLAFFEVGYIIITKTLQAIVSPSRHYVEGFMQWGTKGFEETIKMLFRTIWRISWSTGKDHAYVTMWLFSALFIVLFLVGVGLCRRSYKILYILCMCGLFFSNYLMMVVAGNTMPERTFLTLPIFAAVVIAIFLEFVVREKIYPILCFLVIFVVLIQSAHVTDLFWAEERRQQNDEVMMTKLTSEIAEVGEAWIPEVPVVILCDTEYANYDGTFGFSYFTLGDRIYSYLRYYGFDYIQGNEEQKSYARERVKSMPTFPAEGSVIGEDGIIIVNCLTSQ